MVVMRLSRFGSKHRPRYRVTVADSRHSVKGRFIEIIGYCSSFGKKEKSSFKIDIEKYKRWLSQGAQPSRTLRNLVKKTYSGSEV